MIPIVFWGVVRAVREGDERARDELRPAEDGVDACGPAASDEPGDREDQKERDADAEERGDERRDEHLVLAAPPTGRHPNPAAATAEPMIPPMSAWLELDGRPKSQVTRFHVMAPTSPASTTLRSIASWSTMPVAIVAATSNDTNAPATLRIAAIRTADLGLIARVETVVAIEFAVSWKPFVKSKKSATATTATSVASTPPA